MFFHFRRVDAAKAVQKKFDWDVSTADSSVDGLKENPSSEDLMEYAGRIIKRYRDPAGKISQK